MIDVLPTVHDERRKPGCETQNRSLIGFLNVSGRGFSFFHICQIPVLICYHQAFFLSVQARSDAVMDVPGSPGVWDSLNECACCTEGTPISIQPGKASTDWYVTALRLLMFFNFTKSHNVP